MLVYMGGESLDIREEPLLGWIITNTQQTAEEGEYGIIQRLMSPAPNEAQLSQEMLVLRDFQNNQQGTLTDIDVPNDANREL